MNHGLTIAIEYNVYSFYICTYQGYLSNKIFPKKYYKGQGKLARNKKLECILEYAYLNHSRLNAYI